LPVGSSVLKAAFIRPLLFIIYTNDVVNTVSLSDELSGMYLYADDAKLFSINSVDLQHALDKFSVWLLNQQLT